MDDTAAKLLDRLRTSNLGEIGLTFGAAIVFLIVAQRLLGWLAEGFTGRVRLYLLASVPIVRLTVLVATLTLVVPQLVEPTFENLVALLGIAGLAIGFALRDYISSVVAGLVSLFEIPYRPGDWVEIDGVYGEVRSIRMRVMKMVTPDDTVVLVPHGLLWNHLVRNGTDGTANLMCVADFYLHPRHDAELAQQILSDVALTSAYLQMERPVTVVVAEKPWGTHYRVKAYPIDPRDQFQFLSDITVRGKQALTAIGAEFAQAPPAVPAA
jgi:small-conductance mechanosensitive channel